MSPKAPSTQAVTPEVATDEAPPKGKRQRKERKERQPKPAMPEELAVDADGNSIVDDDGRYTGIPVNWTSKFQRLTKKSFADEATFIEFQAHQMTQRIEDMTERRDELLAEAELSRKLGNSEVRKSAKRAERLRRQLAKLEEELAAEGIEI